MKGGFVYVKMQLSLLKGVSTTGGKEACMKRAVIDIGTNSVRLLEAEKTENTDWKVCKKEINSTRLGEGMTDNSKIPEAAKERTLQAIREFSDTAKSDGYQNIQGYGTSVMREASNGVEFANEIAEATGVPVRILSGREEAFYSYIGAVGQSRVITSVVDIGGGSTEICLGFGNDIGMRYSFRMGAVRCSHLFDSTSPRGVGEIKKYCFEMLRHTDLINEVNAVKNWIIVGGTATSMAAVLQEMEVYDSGKVQGYTMDQKTVTGLLDRLCRMTYDERCHLPGLKPERAESIVAGAVILDALMEYFAIPEVHVSDRDLSEGLLDADMVMPKD